MAPQSDLFVHEGWRAARQRIVKARAAFPSAPSVLVLLGPPGCGKTRLLTALTIQFRRMGAAVHVFAGALPAVVGRSDILLVDKATEYRAVLAGWLEAPPCFTVLAGRADLSHQLIDLLTPTLFVHMAPMRPDEILDFIAQRGPSTGSLVRDALPDGLDALAERPDCYPGPLAALIAERLATPAHDAVPPALPVADRTASAVPDGSPATPLQAGGSVATPPLPAEPFTPRPRMMQATVAGVGRDRGGIRRPGLLPGGLLVGALGAAALAVTLFLSRPSRPVATMPVPATRLADLGPAVLAQARRTDRWASVTPPPAVTIEAAAAAGAPGLVLIAQTGDTLPSLYRKVYDGLTPPDYAVVATLNQPPVKPGSTLIFPAPPGGWARP